jgi:NTP pyrophosphatase (non-canonical NTP hydrolase)
MSKSISDLVKEVRKVMVANGWHDKPRTFGDDIALIHSEASEAFEDHRNGKEPDDIWYEYTIEGALIEHPSPELYLGDVLVLGKPCGIPSELADIIIRVCDTAGRYDVDLDEIIAQKMKYNETRSSRHGGKTV